MCLKNAFPEALYVLQQEMVTGLLCSFRFACGVLASCCFKQSIPEMCPAHAFPGARCVAAEEWQGLQGLKCLPRFACGVLAGCCCRQSIHRVYHICLSRGRVLWR